MYEGVQQHSLKCVFHASSICSKEAKWLVLSSAYIGLILLPLDGLAVVMNGSNSEKDLGFFDELQFNLAKLKNGLS